MYVLLLLLSLAFLSLDAADNYKRKQCNRFINSDSENETLAISDDEGNFGRLFRKPPTKRRLFAKLQSEELEAKQDNIEADEFPAEPLAPSCGMPSPERLSSPTIMSKDQEMEFFAQLHALRHMLEASERPIVSEGSQHTP